MVQAPPKIVFNPQGQEHNNSNSSIVTITPPLPNYVEVRTTSLINSLSNIYKFDNKPLIQNWLNTKQKTGFCFEINEHLYIGFADQRDGRGTQYWWFIYYDNTTRRQIIDNIKIEENLVSTRLEKNRVKEELLWNGLTFRSQTEKRIARALYSQKIIFFANTS